MVTLSFYRAVPQYRDYSAAARSELLRFFPSCEYPDSKNSHILPQ